mgnify:CR=1 FL=1
MSPSLFYSTDATKDFDIVTMTWDLGPLIFKKQVDLALFLLLCRHRSSIKRQFVLPLLLLPRQVFGQVILGSEAEARVVQ